MKKLPEVFANNKRWVKEVTAEEPSFFSELAKGQSPEYLWVGCADSRVPANQILGLNPGSVFVHRNVANLVVGTDVNFLSVLQYAVEALKVRHVIICGHTGCGGVEAAYVNEPLGLIDQWIRPIHLLSLHHKEELEAIEDRGERLKALVKLNVKSQALNLARMPVVQKAWRSGQELVIHGWLFDLGTGLLEDLDACYDGPEGLPLTPTLSSPNR